MIRRIGFAVALGVLLLGSSGQAQPRGHISITQLSQPESIVYFLLRDRNRAGIAPPVDLERNLRFFRSCVHDRKRQVRGEWITPHEFTRRRKAFDTLQAEAREHFRQAKPKKNATPREQATQSRHRAAGQAKLRQAAQAWVDPLLRRFLLAEAAYQFGDAGQAERFFHQCVEDEPRVAAFYEGRARALMKLNRHAEALRMYMQALTLMPDSRDAVGLLRQALKNSPGSKIESPAFRDAKARLEAYKSNRGSRPSRTRETTTWLFPCKTIRSKDTTLPELPMDRLIVRQALAVPVAKHTLLVDARILGQAKNVIVRIDDKTLVAGTVVTRIRRKNNAPPLALVNVPDSTFPPLPVLAENAKPGDALQAHTVNVYSEMGSERRTQPVQLVEGEKAPRCEPSPALAAGESAAGLLTAKGELAGFVVRDLDPMKDHRPEIVYLADDLAPLRKRLGKKPSRRRRSKRTITPKPAKGRTFLVYAIEDERLGNKK